MSDFFFYQASWEHRGVEENCCCRGADRLAGNIVESRIIAAVAYQFFFNTRLTGEIVESTIIAAGWEH